MTVDATRSPAYALDTLQTIHSGSLALFAFASLSLLSACGGSPKPADAPVADAKPAATSADAEAKADDAPADVDSAAEKSGEDAKPAEEDGRLFAGWDPGKKVQITGKEAWTIGERKIGRAHV